MLRFGYIRLHHTESRRKSLNTETERRSVLSSWHLADKQTTSALLNASPWISQSEEEKQQRPRANAQRRISGMYRIPRPTAIYTITSLCSAKGFLKVNMKTLKAPRIQSHKTHRLSLFTCCCVVCSQDNEKNECFHSGLQRWNRVFVCTELGSYDSSKKNVRGVNICRLQSQSEFSLSKLSPEAVTHG